MGLKYPKKQRYTEIDSWSHVLQPTRDELLAADYTWKGRWAAGYFGNDRPLVLELGCGRGEYTVALARLTPDRNILGFDFKGSRLWRGARTVAHEAIANAAFIRARAEFLRSIFGPGELSEIWLTFPDPQYLKPQKRLSGPPHLGWYHDFLVAGGTLHLKTDSLLLYQALLADAAPHGFAVAAAADDLAATTGVLDPALAGICTTYEARYRHEGKKIRYVRLMRTPTAEPPI